MKVICGLVLCLHCLVGRSAIAPKYFYGGVPKPTGTLTNHHITIITNVAYVVGYDEDRKNPAWVAYRLIKKKPAFELDRPSSGYPMDEKTLSKIPANAYADSPLDPLIGNKRWDHGHMAANDAIAKVFGREAQEATFKMSNMCPQSHRLNGGKWKSLESKEYAYAQQTGELWTICGPIFTKHIRTLTYGIEVPSGYYKILVRQKQGTPQIMAVAFEYFPLEGGSTAQYLKDHLASVRDLERVTNLDFFADLPMTVQDEMERLKAPALW